MAVNEERELKLCELFEKYGKSKSLAIGSMNDKKYKELTEDEKKVPQKVRLIFDMVAKIKRQLNSMGLGKRFTLNPTFSFSMKESADFPLKIGSLVTGNGSVGERHTFFVNLKAADIMVMPYAELYATLKLTIFSHMLGHEAIEGMKTKEHSVIHDRQFYQDGTHALEEQKEEFKLYAKQKKARQVIKAHLKAHFERVCEYGSVVTDNFTNFEPIADLVACEMLEDLDANQIDELLNSMYTKEFLEAAFDEAYNFILTSDAAYDSRISRLGELSKAKFEAGPEAVTEALSYQQQHDALLNLRTTSAFNKMKTTGVDPSGNLIPNKDLQNFCIEYINSYMQSNGLKPVRVTFYSVNSKGQPLELGTFFDSENPRININLGKIKSATELAMTLSHELAHAVDSSKNKVRAVDGATMSRGLVDYIGDDISKASDKLKDANNNEALALLEKVNKLCYQVSPNERNARVMELSALKFMQSVTNDDFDRKEIEASVESFISYQQATIDAINELRNGGFEELREKIDALEIPDSVVREAFLQRMAYLAKFMHKMFERNFDIDFEQNSIEEAQSFLNGTAPEKKIVNSAPNNGKELSPEELAALEALQRQ